MSTTERHQAFLDAYEALCREHNLTFYAWGDRDGELDVDINDYDETDLRVFREAV